MSFFNIVTELILAQFARNPLFGVPTWNPLEPTFWVPTWNPEPIGTHFLGSDLEPGTHRNPLRPNLPGTRNPPEPIFLKVGWVPPGTQEPDPCSRLFRTLSYFKPEVYSCTVLKLVEYKLLELGQLANFEPSQIRCTWISLQKASYAKYVPPTHLRKIML